jgi:hypothetical protein
LWEVKSRSANKFPKSSSLSDPWYCSMWVSTLARSYEIVFSACVSSFASSENKSWL